MATILLSAVGAAFGAGFGGTVLGLSGAVIGRAVGATLGRVIDQRLLGAGSDVVDSGRIERFRLTGASEGAPVGLAYGRIRSAGQIIWATQFQENVSRQGGGKGSSTPSGASYSYTVSLAIALCEGVILGVGRVWADGVEIDPTDLQMRIYAGSDDQLVDPKIAAVEGASYATAYRGIAYVVLEDLDLSRFGNRVPQFNFEVIRPAQGEVADAMGDLRTAVQSVAMMPGTGEYALAATALHYNDGPGLSRTANAHSATGKSDFSASLGQLTLELPVVKSVSMIVSWFGNDLRCGSCELRPMVEQTEQNAQKMSWRSGGILRSQAEVVPKIAGLSVYGGTPADASVIEAIQATRASGKEVMFYPFILMDQLEGNGLPNPWSDEAGQPRLPWRGRITASKAPGQPGTPDRTATAELEVAAFFGTAQSSDFSISSGRISYSGPAEWRYRRFILHYAHLCAQAGGVDAFCIGSEMRGLTQIRGASDSFPAVAALRQLAADVRGILGSDTKVTYAADWTEYSGYQTDGNVYFHLDPLWADPEIDFIGIDNYMPASDWRAQKDHADAAWGSIYNIEYLKANITGGEGYDWYYDSPEGQEAQLRLPIEDGAYDEPWVFRYKDLKGWWNNEHFERVDGVRQLPATAWVPQSKPIWFTEYGCAAIDKGTNQPNKFLDPKSSESSLPNYSNGRRDDVIQMQYLRATAQAWADPQNNPTSTVYGGPMLDMEHAHVWAWDARPFPAFPKYSQVWSDSENHSRGHWLTGRATNQSLAGVVAEICERSGLSDFDVSGLYGVVRGYQPEGSGTARSALQPLMLAYGFEAIERDGILRFQMRGASQAHPISRDGLVQSSLLDGTLETARTTEAEIAGRVRLSFIEAEGDFAIRQAEAIFPDEVSYGVSQSEVPLGLTVTEGRGVVERWLSEARVARDTARFVLPPSKFNLGAGDTVSLDGTIYRIDRLEQGEAGLVEAVRIEPSVYEPSDAVEDRTTTAQFTPQVPVYPLFLDLPLLTGDEVPHAPHIAVTASPWPGAVAVWSAVTDDGYALNSLIQARSIIGVTQSALFAARPGLWDRSEAVRIKLSSGQLSSASEDAVLAGANVIAIGDGSSDKWEVFQFSDALLVDTNTYELSTRLRGQLGSDAIMPDVWPVGSLVVVLDSAPSQIDLASTARGLVRNYRIGSAARGLDDPNVVHTVEAFAGIGLRPYSPAHLRARRDASGDYAVSWIRRTRIDGDRWDAVEVPLGEDLEQYLIRVSLNGEIVRKSYTSSPNWIYSAAQQASDLSGAGFSIAVAQVSERFGSGPFKQLDVIL